MPEMSPKEVAERKKRIKNPGGSVSTERSITIQTDQGYVNIPTIIDGIQLSKKDAVDRFRKSGKSVTVYKTLDAAIRAAKKRSEDIGAEIERQRRLRPLSEL